MNDMTKLLTAWESLKALEELTNNTCKNCAEVCGTARSIGRCKLAQLNDLDKIEAILQAQAKKMKGV